MEQTIPILQEHQSGRDINTTSPQGYTASPEENKAIQLVEKLYQRAKKNRKKYDEKWPDRYKMFRGKQWDDQRPSYRHAEVFNLIFQMIQSEVPIMTDGKPKFEFMPQEPSDIEFAQIINDVVSADWQKKNWLYKLTEMLYDSRFYGTAIGAVDFNQSAERGAGDIEFCSKDVFYQFPDPNAVDVNEKSDFYIEAEPIDVEKLKREYPDKAAFIKPDLIDLVQGDKVDLDQVKFRSPTDVKTVIEGSSVYDIGARDQTLKLTLYLKDNEFLEEEIKERDSDGAEQVRYAQRLKYPNGRKICVASGILLHDGPNPYEDGAFPYFRLVNYMDPRSFWGIGDVEQLTGPQKTFNKVISFVLDVLTLMGNPIWVVDTTSGIDTDNLFNRPGAVIEKEPGTEARREEGVQLQPYVLQLIDRLKLWFDDISGNNDVSRGVNPEGGVTAASAIENLQNAAQTRVRQKSRNLDAALQNMGQLYLSRILQFRTAPQVYRITNNQNVTKYFRFHVAPQTDEAGNPILADNGDPQRIAHITPFIQNPETGQYSEGEPNQIPIKGALDVKVATGSSLPFAKNERISMANMAVKIGAIDEPAWLEAVDYPNWEVVWERVKQRRAEMSQMAAQQGGPPTAPPGTAA